MNYWAMAKNLFCDVTVFLTFDMKIHPDVPDVITFTKMWSTYGQMGNLKT